MMKKLETVAFKGVKILDERKMKNTKGGKWNYGYEGDCFLYCDGGPIGGGGGEDNPGYDYPWRMPSCDESDLWIWQQFCNGLIWKCVC